MARIRLIADQSFRAKMLTAVISVMSLLVAVSLGLVSQQFKRQIQADASAQLQTAAGVLRTRQVTREDELQIRFNSANNEPRFRAAILQLFQEKDSPERQNTFRDDILGKMIKARVADVIILTPRDNPDQAVKVAADPHFNLDQLSDRCAGSIRNSLASQSSRVETAACNGALFDVVTQPITDVENSSVVGVITFAVTNTIAREFRITMRNYDDLVLLLDNQVVASTLPGTTDPGLVEKFAAMAAQSTDQQEIKLGGETYLGIAGRFGHLEEPNRLSYLILSSVGAQQQVLHATQRSIILTGVIAILSGIAVVWFLVRKITEPLRDLQASAEAVGRGDFSRRVDIRTRDEFGALGHAFNQMTEDIRRSHSELTKAVSTLKNTQAQLVQSEKLSAVGEFVAGVAHELNNPLAAVMGFSEMLKDADVSENHRRHLNLIFKSAERCRKIVQSLLSFARRHQPERKPVSVNKLIEEVLEIVAYQLRTSNVDVVCRFAPALPLVLADGHQIQQVVLNLVNNARQAIEGHQESGCITVTTELQSKAIRISIHDNGPGIPAENLSRIFDPFFTTKEVGKGTGLGLSLCYGLIREHGGSIAVSSQPGHGANFIIELPATDVILPADGPTPARPDPAAAQEGAGKKILLVDDETILLEMIREGLKKYGYEVVTANNGEAALRELHAAKIDAICSDIKMPGLNGRQLFEWIRASRPDAARRLIFMTGDLINENLQMFLDQEHLVCLHKPFPVGDLRHAIKKIIHENTTKAEG